MRHMSAVFILILVVTRGASAETYVVNPEGTGDFPTIQAAIDSVLDGDVIELTDGRFTGDGNRDIDYLGKAITVSSQSGNPTVCIIDCEGAGRGFRFHSDEGPESRLEGITVSNGCAPGTGWTSGGAIMCEWSSPTVTNCAFESNRAVQGGAIRCNGSSATIASCVFIQNSAEPDGYGGAFSVNDGSPAVEDCTFDSNSAREGGAIDCYVGWPSIAGCLFRTNSADTGGAIAWTADWYPDVSYCIFDGNFASWGGAAVAGIVGAPLLRNCTFYANHCPAAENRGVICAIDAYICLENCIIAFNSTMATYCHHGASYSRVYGECCDRYGNPTGPGECFWDNGGNIELDPLFCDPAGGDFHLEDASPCAPFSPPNPECDLIGAWPVGCGGTPVFETTWGGIKALFR